ncbi:hypothetical protein Avbf_06135 [Armadillidium vulgare]|nr:hypothetical protein Avbf_06135 [Armadillidium vulgare]
MENLDRCRKDFRCGKGHFRILPEQGLVCSVISPRREIINTHLARAIFATGCPLSLVENRYWRKAFEVYVHHTRYLLAFT